MENDLIDFHTTAFDTVEARLAASLLPDAEREEFARALLVPFEAFDKSIDFIRRRHRPNPNGGHSRGRVVGLLGEIRSGKSWACMHYAASYPMRLVDGNKKFPVVYIPVPGSPTIKSVTTLLQKRSGAHSVTYHNADDAKDASVDRLKRGEAELVVFDDAQFMLFHRDAPHFFDLIKRIVDTNRMNVLLVGEKSIYDYMDSNGHLKKRGGFAKHFVPPILKNGVAFRNLIGSIDKRLPFRSASVLTHRHVVDDLWKISGGVIGLIMNLVVDAAIMAIADGAETLELRHLQLEADDRYQEDTYRYFRMPTDAREGANA
ncbi:TniB family NTP-binding protein [Rhizobium leguminosarum]|uniref:TniB family NTP-binding protein n=1 Tax=Rhizobium leguminosarum TaxID=384 RepID=UPI0014410606|nr:TniB family NTP-binding protein [Rhizobium leguminosarum]NKL77618.1 AAA family ATPase [Rhizobium leguminosarum bv. viciae]